MLLQTGGHIRAVAVDVPPFDDDIAEVDSDARLDPPVLRLLSGALCHLPLELDRALDGVDDAGELDLNAVAQPYWRRNFRLFGFACIVSALYSARKWHVGEVWPPE